MPVDNRSAPVPRRHTADMDNEIPALRPFDQMDSIRDAHDLLAYWRALMGELGFSERVLWLLFVRRDGTAMPHLTQVAELPEYPDSDLSGLMTVCEEVSATIGEGTCVAMLLSRPGSGGLDASDRAWGARIVEAASRHRVGLHPLHVANDQQIRVVAPDDLLGVA